jgi:rhamnulokinase
MEKLYIACDFGAQTSCAMLGTLHNGTLTLGELRRFQTPVIRGKNSLEWNIPELYRETLEALRELASQEANVAGISCSSWGGDYMLFGPDASLLTPVLHHADPRGAAGMKEVLGKISRERLFEETGIQCRPGNTLFQLANESPRRLKSAARLLPFADGFNHLLCGSGSAELSLASTTQFFNPVTRTWSVGLFDQLDLRKELLPAIVPAGTKLGMLRPDIAKQTGLDGVTVIATCSHQSAAALAGLPHDHGDDWACLRVGSESVLGTATPAPIITPVARELGYSNELGLGGNMYFSKPMIGLRLMEECWRYWVEKDRELSDDVLLHLATTSTAFECLINVADPRFAEPGEMPLKIQAYCRDTSQEIPRKPGQIVRCVLESLALEYRKAFQELELITGKQFTRLHLLGASENTLLNYFIANALQVPVILASPDAAAIGNALVQALALRHVASLDEAREILGSSVKTQAIIPHSTSWEPASERLLELASFSKPAAA